MRFPLLRGLVKFKYKLKGFTFIEVLVAALLLGLLVSIVQSTTENLLSLRKISSEDNKAYIAAKNIFLHIHSGRSFVKYILTPSEKNILRRKGIDPEKINLVVEHISDLKLFKNEKRIIFDNKIIYEKLRYKLLITREVIEPSPFLFGIKLEIITDKGKKAELKGILSYYDFISE